MRVTGIEATLVDANNILVASPDHRLGFDCFGSVVTDAPVSVSGKTVYLTGDISRLQGRLEGAPAKVTNNAKAKLHFSKAYQYDYDKDGKQLGREFGGRTVGTLEPGQSKEFPFGLDKDKLPKGTEKIEFVFVGANFADKVEFKGDAKALAPDQRPMKSK